MHTDFPIISTERHFKSGKPPKGKRTLQHHENTCAYSSAHSLKLLKTQLAIACEELLCFGWEKKTNPLRKLKMKNVRAPRRSPG